MSREEFSQTPDGAGQDELSRFVDAAIASYRKRAEAEEQYESPVPVFDEETGHYVYQQPSGEEEEGEDMQDLTEEEQQEDKEQETEFFRFDSIGEEGQADTEDTEEAEETDETGESGQIFFDEAEREQQLFREANRLEETPSPIPNPLPVPRKKDHVELDYDREEIGPMEKAADPEDDFDFEIDEDDDFDI